TRLLKGTERVARAVEQVLPPPAAEHADGRQRTIALGSRANVERHVGALIGRKPHETVDGVPVPGRLRRRLVTGRNGKRGKPGGVVALENDRTFARLDRAMCAGDRPGW